VLFKLWDRLILTASVELQGVKEYFDRRELKSLVHFSMALWDNFEGLHETILQHTPLSTDDLIRS
jgi:hypothetical protein